MTIRLFAPHIFLALGVFASGLLLLPLMQAKTQELGRILSAAFVLSLLIVLFYTPNHAEAAFSSPVARGSTAIAAGNNASISVTPSATITADKILFAVLVKDNFETTNGCSLSDQHTIADTQSNSWTWAKTCTATAGSANDGVELSYWWTKVSNQLSTSDSVTVTFSNSSSDAIIALVEVTVDVGNTIEIENDAGSQTDPPSVTLSGLSSGTEYFLLAMHAEEGELADHDADADYTERFDVITGTGGQPNSNLQLYVQTRIASGITSDTAAPVGGTWSEAPPQSFLSGVIEVAGVTNPTVATGFVGNVGPTYATLFGAILATGDSSITQHGFATSTSADLTSDVSTTTLGSGSVGEYSGPALFASPDTTYYYRAYARNTDNLTGYGQIRSLTTGNTSITRKMRLFSSYFIRFFNGRIILYQR